MFKEKKSGYVHALLGVLKDLNILTAIKNDRGFENLELT